MSFTCPICDEGLTAAAPNYDRETLQAQELTGEPVVVGEIPPISTSRHKRLGTKAAAKSAKGKPVPKSTIISTPCGHLFHSVCLDQWFKSQAPRTCPSCRKTCQHTKMVHLFPVITEHDRSFNYNEAGPSTSTSCAGQAAAAKVGGGATGVPIITIDNNGQQGAVPAPPVANPANGNAEAHRELREIHDTLVRDYAENQERLNEAMEKTALQEAIINSFESLVEDHEQEIEKRDQEIQKLKEALEAASATAPSGGAVRKVRASKRTNEKDPSAPPTTTTATVNNDGGETLAAPPAPKRSRPVRARKPTEKASK